VHVCQTVLLAAVQVRCSADQKAIIAMASSDGEVVELNSPVTATDAVESWLHQLTDGMQQALQRSLQGVAGLSDPFVQAPAQVLGLYHALSFTERCVVGSWFLSADRLRHGKRYCWAPKALLQACMHVRLLVERQACSCPLSTFSCCYSLRHMLW